MIKKSLYIAVSVVTLGAILSGLYHVRMAEMQANLSTPLTGLAWAIAILVLTVGGYIVAAAVWEKCDVV